MDGLQLSPTRDGNAVLELVGEHDISNAEALREAVDGCDAGTLVVDLARCTFVDSTVIGVLVRAARSRRVLLTQVHGEPLRAIRTVGLDALMPVIELPAQTRPAELPQT